MKKQLFAILFALAAVSCTKEIVEQETENQVPTPDITFSATTGQDEPADSKSYIGKTDETSSILYWSPYDDLGVYCYTKELGESGGELSLKATSKLVKRVTTNATFDGKHDWNTVPSDNYYFYAYYPELTGSPKEVTDGVISGFTVPSYQVKHFGYYHICSTNGFGTISSAEMYGSRTVKLDFAPRTALFTIKVNLAPESTLEQVQLSYVKVTFDGVDAEGKTAHVTGDCQLNLKDGSLTYTGNGSNVVEVSMNDYYDSVPTSIVKKQAEGVRAASFDMVLLPLTGFTGTVTFDFMTSDPVSIAPVTKTINGKSFASGKHYVSTIEIAPDVPKGRDEMANSYIVDATTTTSLKIPIKQGAKGWEAIDKYNKTTKSSSENFEDRFWQALDGEVTGELLWSETEGMSISCTRNGDFLDVDFIRSENGSNALIALKDTEGNVLWSWHIWFTDYNPDIIKDEASLKVAGGYVHKYQGTEWAAGGIYADKYIMDRNLGAKMIGVETPGLPNDKGDQTHSGLYYQYGRKDPFIPKKFTPAEGPVTMDNGALNPTKFYYRTDGFDWAVNTDHVNTDPWAGYSKTALPKSAFDPCPKGWRVPVAYKEEDNEVNTWSGFKGKLSDLSAPSASVGAFVQRNNGFYYRGTNSGYGGTTTNTNNAAYPSTGRLSYKDGTLVVTEEVNLWSASPQQGSAKQQHTARYFYANTNASGAFDGYDTAINAQSRAAGMPVRCIKE